LETGGARDTAGTGAERQPLLPLFDANVFCGNYPFRALPCASPAELASFLAREQIGNCIATPFESNFYRQPWEGLQSWLNAPEISVQFWLVVNPLMPGWELDVAKAQQHPQVAGLRLFPRYHGYGLDHPALQDVADAAAALNLPINLSARLLDDRLHPAPLRADPPLSMTAVAKLLADSPGNRWMLSMFFMAELKQCAEVVTAHGNVFVDIGCSKPFEFWEDDIRAIAPLDRIILGTGAPLYYHLGTRISFQRTNLTDAEKTTVLQKNLEALISA
jgi:hypothetical protein